MNLMRSIVSLLLTGAFALTMPGCKDADLAIGLGAVAIGVGAIAVGVGSSGGEARCRGGYKEKCTTYRDRYGRRHRECRQVYDSCLYYYNYEPGQLSGGQQLLNTHFGIEADHPFAAELAQRHNLSFEAANKILGALDEAREGKLTGVLALGLDRSDIEDLARLRLPSNKGLEALSDYLDIDKKDIKKMLASILDDFTDQLGDFDSHFWQNCTRSGKWKTPQNNSCQQSYWPGCSPQTGATLCM